MNQHKEIMLGWEYLLETSSFTGWTQLKSNYFILHKVPVIGSCQMDKYCNGSVASLARTLTTCSTSIRLFAPLGEGCCKRLTETRQALSDQQSRVFIPGTGCKQNTGQFGARVQKLDREEVVLPEKGSSANYK